MDWFNYIGLIVMVLIIIPNIVFSIIDKDMFKNSYNNKKMIMLEQIGRYSSMVLMVINIPYTYFGFFFKNALITYIIINSILLFIYYFSWFFLYKKHKIIKAYFLSILPTTMLLFSGIMLRNIPLIVISIFFGIAHITISLKNAYETENG